MPNGAHDYACLFDRVEDAIGADACGSITLQPSHESLAELFGLALNERKGLDNGLTNGGWEGFDVFPGASGEEELRQARGRVSPRRA
jgi:hypothetical protein